MLGELKEDKPKEATSKAQKLILPIDEAKLTASWQTQAYFDHFQCEHFGIDLVSLKLLPSASDSGGRDRAVRSIGSGKVINVGKDAVTGNTVIALYENVLHHRTKRIITVIARFCHLDEIQVLPRQRLTPEIFLGTYGHTGLYNITPHLHLEIDVDIESPYTTPTIQKSNFLRRVLRGKKMTMMLNPLDVLHVKTGKQYKQSFITADNMYILDTDKEIPVIR